MVIWPLANDVAEMTNVGTGAGLIVEVHRQGSVKGTVRISGVRLRIRGYTDTIPATEKIFCV